MATVAVPVKAPPGTGGGIEGPPSPNFLAQSEVMAHTAAKRGEAKKKTDKEFADAIAAKKGGVATFETANEMLDQAVESMQADPDFIKAESGVRAVQAQYDEAKKSGSVPQDLEDKYKAVVADYNERAKNVEDMRLAAAADAPESGGNFKATREGTNQKFLALGIYQRQLGERLGRYDPNDANYQRTREAISREAGRVNAVMNRLDKLAREVDPSNRRTCRGILRAASRMVLGVTPTRALDELTADVWTPGGRKQLETGQTFFQRLNDERFIVDAQGPLLPANAEVMDLVANKDVPIGDLRAKLRASFAGERAQIMSTAAEREAKKQAAAAAQVEAQAKARQAAEAVQNKTAAASQQTEAKQTVTVSIEAEQKAAAAKAEHDRFVNDNGSAALAELKKRGIVIEGRTREQILVQIDALKDPNFATTDAANLARIEAGIETHNQITAGREALAKQKAFAETIGSPANVQEAQARLNDAKDPVEKKRLFDLFTKLGLLGLVLAGTAQPQTAEAIAIGG